MQRKEIPFISSLPFTGTLFFFKTLTKSFSIIHSFLQRNPVSPESNCQHPRFDHCLSQNSCSSCTVTSQIIHFSCNLQTGYEDLHIYDCSCLEKHQYNNRGELELSSNHEWPLPPFSIASESSMDRAIVTPSLITWSDPDSERKTLRPAYFHLKSIPLSN